MREKISLDLADVASSYGLVRFQPLVVTDERLIRNVILQVNATIIGETFGLRRRCSKMTSSVKTLHPYSDRIFRQIKQLD